MKKTALILVVFLLACPPPYERRYAPLTGSVVDSLGNGIEDIRLYTFELIDYPHPWDEIEALIDSSISDQTGVWGMSRGYPWDAYVADNGCTSPSEIEDMASSVNFVLGIITPDLDSLTYLVVNANYNYDRFFVDSIWQDERIFYKTYDDSLVLGGLINLAPIVLQE